MPVYEVELQRVVTILQRILVTVPARSIDDAKEYALDSAEPDQWDTVRVLKIVEPDYVVCVERA